MNTKSTTISPTPPLKFSNRRLAREWKTVRAMIHIYCRDQHGGTACRECQELMRYVNVRLDRCRFGADKPTCAKCPVHCYQRDSREQIKVVMRYSGPRMLWEHPWLSLCHLLDGWFRRPVLTGYTKPNSCAANATVATPEAVVSPER
jgi:hypothetical protein